jgi:hypothetical protein
MKKLLVIFALLAAAASAQSSIDVTVGSSVVHFKKLPKSTVTFGFTAGTVDAQGNATLAVSSSTSRMPPAGLQFDILYPASVTAITATAGPVVTAAGKSLACNVVSAGDLRCLASGSNQNLILNGVVANVAATINANSTLTLSAPVASNAAGGALATAISQATANVAIALVLQGVVCAVPPYEPAVPAGTYNIEPGESTTCTATLNQPAPAAGYAAPISASAAGLSLPAILAVSSGQTSAQFTVTGQ